jgi:hypothetical protein
MRGGARAVVSGGCPVSNPGNEGLTMSDSSSRHAGGKAGRPRKPKEPRPDFPLYPNRAGHRAKNVRGSTRYFGR